MRNFWQRLFFKEINTSFERTKKVHEKNWNHPAYLHGVILSNLAYIEQLQKENKQLRENKGAWLSPEAIEKFNSTLESMKILQSIN